jgi:D-alanyl-D-alanine carboxypeptidase
VTNSRKAQIWYGSPLDRGVKDRIISVKLMVMTKGVLALKSVNIHADYAEKLMHDYKQVCGDLAEYPVRVDSYNVRRIAGSSSWSMHSYALALDVFGDDLVDRKTGEKLMSPLWYQEMELLGWTWGGRWKHSDPHHIEITL